MTETFEGMRGRLWGIAYRMLGVPDDADDIVQEAQLRWLQTDRQSVRDADGWLVAVTTRLAIDRLRQVKRQRADYPGPWLPAPVMEAAGPSAPEPPSRAAELASDLSLAFLHLLERLGPEERAAFLLREAFDVGYSDIARTLRRSEAACRQMVHRARERVQGGPRRERATEEERRALAERFARAVEAEDLGRLIELLAPDATHLTDGGGKAWAALREIRGADAVARGMVGASRKAGRELAARGASVALVIGSVNGEPAVLRYAEGQLVSVTTFTVQDGRVHRIFTVLNPEKLTRVGH
jgi:RNA polymerase sigma-70 factor, ECF subfamily